MDPPVCPLGQRETERYSRQLLVPSVGVIGHSRIEACSVLVVGAGGLGSPCALYLAGAGFKKIGLVDGDVVEESNLHRQVMHAEARVGQSKAASGAAACRALNSMVEVAVHDTFLAVDNALELVSAYDVVVDCSDNVQTRYLVSDACVLAGKPLVSGSALRLEGQLTVYNYEGGPCYRCVFPEPPPAESVTDCSDGGVVGPVVGVIGSLQAMEALKVAMRKPAGETMSGRLLLYDAHSCAFRNVRLRARRPDCAVCADRPAITRLEAVPGAAGPQSCPAAPAPLPAGHAASVEELAAARRGDSNGSNGSNGSNDSAVVIDVRDELQYSMCRLAGALSFPLASLHSRAAELDAACKGKARVFVVCRRGIFSRTATATLLEMADAGSFEAGGALAERRVQDVQGGLAAWAARVDQRFPRY